MELGITKEVISTQKQPSCEKGAALKSLGEKSCEIKGGSQQMAAMMLMLIKFNNGLVKFISINIIAAICWPPPLISQLFHPGFLRPHFFHSLAVFVWSILPSPANTVAYLRVMTQTYTRKDFTKYNSLKLIKPLG